MAIVPIEQNELWGDCRDKINSNDAELDQTMLKKDGSVPLTGDLDANSHGIKNVADAADDNAVPRFGQTKSYADSAAGSARDEVLDKLDWFAQQAASGSMISYVVDANAVDKYSVLLTADGSTNLPSGASRWFLITIPHSDGSTLMQMAVSYNAGPLFAFRQKTGDTWSSWVQVPRMRFDSGTSTLYIRDDGSNP